MHAALCAWKDVTFYLTEVFTEFPQVGFNGIIRPDHGCLLASKWFWLHLVNSVLVPLLPTIEAPHGTGDKVKYNYFTSMWFFFPQMFLYQLFLNKQAQGYFSGAASGLWKIFHTIILYSYRCELSHFLFILIATRWWVGSLQWDICAAFLMLFMVCFKFILWDFNSSVRQGNFKC